MQIWEYTNRKDFVIGAVGLLSNRKLAEDDNWTMLIVLGIEKAFFEPVLVVADTLANTPTILTSGFIDEPENLAVAQEYFSSCFARNRGADNNGKPVVFFSMMPKALFSEDGMAKENDGGKGYIVAKVDENYVSAFFNHRIGWDN